MGENNDGALEKQLEATLRMLKDFKILRSSGDCNSSLPSHNKRDNMRHTRVFTLTCIYVYICFKLWWYMYLTPFRSYSSICYDKNKYITLLSSPLTKRMNINILLVKSDYNVCSKHPLFRGANMISCVKPFCW